jgi:homoserine kinase
LIVARAPATTANLGPGFDCAGLALDLWNEVEIADGGDPDREHLGVRAFSLLASPDGRTFTWRTPIPRERGLGSSAAVIALGLAAGAAAAGVEPDPERLLALGLPLEGHADNLAAALVGGACLTWDGRIARVADGVPADAVAVVPRESRVATAASRAALPASVPHAEAAHTAARAALLGAAIASGSTALFGAALDDRLHEPYRAADAPLLARVRAEPPAGAIGATLSGSGPTVIVWAEPGAGEACAAALEATLEDVDVLALAASATGARAATTG